MPILSNYKINTFFEITKCYAIKFETSTKITKNKLTHSKKITVLFFSHFCKLNTTSPTDNFLEVVPSIIFLPPITILVELPPSRFNAE